MRLSALRKKRRCNDLPSNPAHRDSQGPLQGALCTNARPEQKAEALRLGRPRLLIATCDESARSLRDQAPLLFSFTAALRPNLKQVSRRAGIPLGQVFRRVEVFKAAKADLRNIEFHGGGGTDFTPLLEEADKYRPDIGVVLTDLEGPARFRPRWPVIWTVPGAHTHAVPPFGRKLVLSD